MILINSVISIEVILKINLSGGDSTRPLGLVTGLSHSLMFSAEFAYPEFADIFFHVFYN